MWNQLIESGWNGPAVHVKRRAAKNAERRGVLLQCFSASVLQCFSLCESLRSRRLCVEVRIIGELTELVPPGR